MSYTSWLSIDLNKIKNGHVLDMLGGNILEEVIGAIELKNQNKIKLLVKISLPAVERFEQKIIYIPGLKVIQKDKINLFMEDVQFFQLKNGALKLITSYNIVPDD